MFGISLAKILLVAAVAAAVWAALRYLTRAAAPAKGRPHAGPAGTQAPGRVEDMVRCALCGAFQARAAGPCPRHDCPARS